MPTGDYYYYPTTTTTSTHGYNLLYPNATTAAIADNTLSASFNGKIHVHGIDEIHTRLTLIEERLAMLERNLLLETRYKELKELGEKYKQLEQELLEKEKIVEILKR